jgi:hypothetical protein
MVSVQADDDGFIRGFPYHDGFLDAVFTNPDSKEVLLALRSEHGARRILTLKGVSALCLDGFREGNVILNVRVLTAERLLGDSETQKKLASRLSLEAGALEAGSAVFILESSYGADMVAICSDVEISEAGASIIVRV